MPGIGLVILVELFVIAFVVEAMLRSLPSKLSEMAEGNKRRRDGSTSKRRVRQERVALRKLRTDLWAVMLVAVFIANAVILTVHLTAIIPLDLVAKAHCL